MSTVSELKISDQTASTQPTTEALVQDLFNKQKACFATDVTKTYEWRIDQLSRLIRMLKDNYDRFTDASRRDFKTASQENVFEVSATIATGRTRLAKAALASLCLSDSEQQPGAKRGRERLARLATSS